MDNHTFFAVLVIGRHEYRLPGNCSCGREARTQGAGIALAYLKNTGHKSYSEKDAELRIYMVGDNLPAMKLESANISGARGELLLNLFLTRPEHFTNSLVSLVNRLCAVQRGINDKFAHHGERWEEFRDIAYNLAYKDEDVRIDDDGNGFHVSGCMQFSVEKVPTRFSFTVEVPGLRLEKFIKD